jgi:PAS domain S-box-containing protein
MVIVDQQGKIVLANTQAEKLFGYTPKELQGQPVEMLMPEGVRTKHAGHREGYFQVPRARGMDVGLELSGRRKDGTEFPVEISLSPLRTEEGILVTSAIRDISKRRQAEAALKESEAKFDLALESAQMGAWDLDIVNDTAQRSLRHDQIFGYSTLQPKWGAQIFARHLFPDDRESAMARFAEAYRTGQFSMQCRIVWPDKSIHWIDAQGRVYCNDRGEPVRMRGIVADITSRKQIEEALERHRSELARSNAELSAANEEIESFSYSVSHDLRAPLRHIDGFARILLEEHKSQLDSKGQHYLQRVATGAQQMGRLVDDLLNLSRVGRREIQQQPANLSAIVEAIRVDLADGGKGRIVEWKIAPLPVVECDPGLLKLVFTNLLTNALKFSASRERAVIEIGCAEEEGELVFFVRDNGVGFDPKYAGKLFGVFQRLHRQEDFEGTGIGLATVQRIIRKHDGRIWAESRPDCGATFFFTIGRNAVPVHELTAEKEGVI